MIESKILHYNAKTLMTLPLVLQLAPEPIYDEFANIETNNNDLV